MGVLGVLAANTVATAQALPIDSDWDPPQEIFLAGLNKADRPVDMLSWTDTTPAPDETWVYVCGWVTKSNDTKIMAVARYWIEDPDSTVPGFEPRLVFYPPDHATTTLDHVPTAMAVASDGSIFVTAEKETINDGIDYLTVKFDKFLQVDTGWGNSGEMTFDNPNNGQGNEDDKPTDIQVYGLAGTSAERIYVTGTSFHDGE